MRRSLYVHMAPGFTDRVVINRRRPRWSSTSNDYMDVGHAQVVSLDAFSILTGVCTLPPFPKIAVLDQQNHVVNVVRPPKPHRMRHAPRRPQSR
jgi:hypothetical protein